MLRRHLDEGERHVAQGEKHIAAQEQIVEDLGRLGRDALEAKKLLENFYASQIQHIQHRDCLLNDLADSN